MREKPLHPSHAAEYRLPAITFTVAGREYPDAPTAMAAAVALAMRGEPADFEARQHGMIIDRWKITAKRGKV